VFEIKFKFICYTFSSGKFPWDIMLIVFGFVDSDLWLSELIVVFVVVDMLASLVVKPKRQFLLYRPVEAVVLEETAVVVLVDLCLVLVEVVLVELVRQYWELVEKVAV